MARLWEADPAASFLRRLGKPANELDPPRTDGRVDCPCIWELDNGDVAVVGRDLTASYTSRLPADVSIGQDERLVIIPGTLMISAKADIPDA